MTTYHQPLQRRDGRWAYTSCTGSTAPRAIGYCFDGDKPFHALSWDELTDVVRSIYYDDPQKWEAEKAVHAATLGNYHNTGHDTAEEAEACYRRYEVLETLKRYVDQATQYRCAVCDAWTAGVVDVGQGFFKRYHVCDACFSVEAVMKLHASDKAVAK